MRVRNEAWKWGVKMRNVKYENEERGMRNEIEELTCLCTRTRLAFLPEPRFEK